MPSPDASLTEYTETTPEPELQSSPPVPVAGPNETWDDPEFDEEDRIRAIDEFPDRATGADPHPPEEISVSETIGGGFNENQNFTGFDRPDYRRRWFGDYTS